MNYEATLLDQKHGTFRRGQGPNASAAILAAYRKMAQLEIPEGAGEEAKAQFKEQMDAITPTSILQSFCMVGQDDEWMSEPKTLKEDIHDTMIVVRVDRTKDTMYVPCGWVRVVF